MHTLDQVNIKNKREKIQRGILTKVFIIDVELKVLLLMTSVLQQNRITRMKKRTL